MSDVVHCPDCGVELVSEPGIPGLCPHCLLSLAVQAGDRRPPADAETFLDRHGARGRIFLDPRGARGRIFGDRYQVLELLGRGGMGEVFKAFDLKLRIDVALKAVRAGELEHERASEMLRQEVRAAREVVSANVCRVFDLVVEDGQEFVSMEFIDGITLADIMRERGPLALQESREIASQFLSGLEAIHQAGLVHRDLKPENVMITRAGRVVVMDFGLAKAETEGRTATIAGTVPYMSPEQARGDGVDARADVFAAGLILAEMLTAGGADVLEGRRALWTAVRATPPQVPEGPWAPVLRKALDPRREARYASARALAHALEEVTLRLPGFETKRPYPGLASFTEEDAEYFFGREADVEALWRKLKRPRLLAVIGPSGTGKSSFLRAGLLPTLPHTWASAVVTPGNRPFQSLAQALAPSFAGDAPAVQSLLRFEDPDTAVGLVARWRQKHEHALIIEDQFEELFTLNPPATQEAFAGLLARFVLDADVHVLLSLRDDFLFRCHQFGALAPILSDLTLLGPLGDSALRRALVQPALSCGYRFEDEALVEEMVAEVVRERGALPLLAFAASRLWDKRDRERGLLTREAYREIGGVAGALVQHAEATLERAGSTRIPIVRELFRNLVTSQGTRAVRDRLELLSVFDNGEGHDSKARSEADAVVTSLVDARLLTSYEEPGEEGESHQQLEIIHESLLTAWPRLVRWQTQDADGAQVRDQLRQAAHVWQERGRPEDLLWSGTAYRDFTVWRERYPGKLTATEEAFAEAAAKRAGRRRRKRQLAAAAVLTAVMAVAATTSVLWQRSEVSRQRAEAATIRAEAEKLLVMGERELQRYPTAALAYTLKSLELADSSAARLLALRILQRAPVARLATLSGEAAGAMLTFSPDGTWLASGGQQKAELIDKRGERRLLLGDYAQLGPQTVELAFGLRSDLLVGNYYGDIRVWSIPAGQEIGRGRIDAGPSLLHMQDREFLTLTRSRQQLIVRSWPLPFGSPRLVSAMALPTRARTGRAERVLAVARGRTVYLQSMEAWDRPARPILEAPAEIMSLAFSTDGHRLATADGTPEVRIWGIAGRSTSPERILTTTGKVVGVALDPSGRWCFALTFARGHPSMQLFDLQLRETEPLTLEKGDTSNMGQPAFDASGQWFATPHGPVVALWPLMSPRARVLPWGGVWAIQFTPDGQGLLVLNPDRSVAVRPLQHGAGLPRILVPPVADTPPTPFMKLDPGGRHLALAGGGGRLAVVPLEGGAARSLEGFPRVNAMVGQPAFGDGGRLLAAGLLGGPREAKVIRVWDLETGAVRSYGPLRGAGDIRVGGIRELRFAGRDRLLASVWETGTVEIDLRSGAERLVTVAVDGAFVLSHDGRFGIGIKGPLESFGHRNGSLVRFDVEDGTAQPLATHGSDLTTIEVDPTGTIIATGSTDGTVRVGHVSGREPHLLLGQEGRVLSLAFSPDGRWLAAASEADTTHVWPVPDLTRTPVHLRSRAEFLAFLRSHTNLRAVPDMASPGGYRLEAGPFPGWEIPPEW